jgi:aspartate/methionine/tyrosine aminotransferase
MRQERRPILDLTESNPTRAGIPYPEDLLRPLGHPRGLTYAPAPFGLASARHAVSADFARRGLTVSPERIALTASTSEAYSLIFKILCDPGDEVLIPRPSYPLFEHLLRLDAVAAVPYDLDYHGLWSIDMAGVERALTPRTRALLIVNPNNPTGHFVSASDLHQVAALCASQGIAIISDEVFADYALTPGAADGAGQLTTSEHVLGFTLGGLSKSIGLPQVKLAWLALSGPEETMRDAQIRLELACDTYLSVSTPVQAAAGDLFAAGTEVRRAIQNRVTINHQRLMHRTTLVPSCRVLNAEGGWYAVIQVPSLGSEEDLVLALLEENGVLIHPGYFFDFPTESFLVCSLLPPPAVFAEGLEHILGRFADGARP